MSLSASFSSQSVRSKRSLALVRLRLEPNAPQNWFTRRSNVVEAEDAHAIRSGNAKRWAVRQHAGYTRSTESAGQEAPATEL
jgi:hypothetical protein